MCLKIGHKEDRIYFSWNYRDNTSLKKVLRGGSDITTNENTLSLVLQWLFYFKSFATYAQKFIVDIFPGITLNTSFRNFCGKEYKIRQIR